ncbi:MAG: hypothetical protein JWL84_6381 [Rhodospirillales bacterium]|jgi:glycosyltransferase involved in cell wall biosynthesis|nr:hypothetical protein [Rhodospirillales bacterium]
MPFFSIVIACLNDARALPTAIDSVLGQSFTDLEVVIADGGSADATIRYLRNLDDPRVIWRSAPDGGIADAWNKALLLAGGTWIIFLGADDFLWDRTVLARAVTVLRDTKATIAYGDVALIDAAGAVSRVAAYSEVDLLRSLHAGGGIGVPHQGFFHHRRLFDGEARFDVGFPLAADYELIARNADLASLRHLPIGTVAAFRTGGVSTAPGTTLLLLEEFRRIQIKHRREPPPIPLIVRIKSYSVAALNRALGPRAAVRLINLTRNWRGLSAYRVPPRHRLQGNRSFPPEPER